MVRALALLTLVAGGCSALIGLEDPTLGTVDARLPIDAAPAIDAAPTIDAAPAIDGPPLVRLIVSVTGTGSGRVRSQPPGIIDCTRTSGTCASDFPAGTMVTLTPTPNGGSRFDGWKSGCGGNSSCELMLDADKGVEAGFADLSGGHNFVFITSENYFPLDLSPIDKADRRCMESAAAAGLPGTYVAWLSTSMVNAKDRIKSARGWVRVDGKPFVDTVTDLVQGRIFLPVHLSARGVAVTSPAQTATTPAGVFDALSCGDFTDAAMAIKGGWPGSTTESWTAALGTGGFGCNQPLSLICFGTDRSVPVTPTPATGRLAFITASAWDETGGFTVADGMCSSEAAGAGKSGKFKAVIATSAFSMASRFDLGGRPWVRADGIPIARASQTPFDGDLEAPINVTADGTYVGARFVVLGATAPTAKGTATTTCADWTMGQPATFAFSVAVDSQWFPDGGQTVPCNVFPHVYCFEE